MQELLQQIIDNPLASLAVVGNLIIIESLLSVDNAAVLATMVMDLPKEQRYKALGGKIEVILKPGVDHHPHSLKDPQPIVDFLLKNAYVR